MTGACIWWQRNSHFNVWEQNKNCTSVCAESLVFTCVRVWCSPVVDEASQFIMSTWEDLLEMWQCHNEDEWEAKLVVFLLFCIDIWIMDSVLNNDFRILAIVFWITAIVNQYWTVANLYNDCQLIKGAPVCGKIARFWKNVTDSSWRWIQG